MYRSLLACTHYFYTKYTTPPRVGDVVPCMSCGDYQLVIYDRTHWRAKCCDCNYSRGAGADEEWAEKMAHRHAVKYVGHRVKIFQEQSPEQWRIVTAKQEPLDVGDPLF